MSERRVEFRPSPAHFPFESRWFESRVGQVHYVDEGSGRPLLLVHGNPTWSFLYRKIIRELRSSGFRCLALDLPGYGLSVHPDDYRYTAAEHAEIVLAFIRHLDLRGAVVMGTDWGGPIGLWAAAQDADRIAGLVLGSTFAWPVKGALMWLIARVMRSRFMQRHMIHSNRFVERVVRSMIQAEISEAELAHYRETAPNPAFRRGIAELPRQLLDAGPWLARLEQEVGARLGGKPILLLPGRKERLLGATSVVRRFQKMFPEHRVVELAHAGHFIQEDAPGEVAAAIRARFGSGV